MSYIIWSVVIFTQISLIHRLYKSGILEEKGIKTSAIKNACFRKVLFAIVNICICISAIIHIIDDSSLSLIIDSVKLVFITLALSFAVDSHLDINIFEELIDKYNGKNRLADNDISRSSPIARCVFWCSFGIVPRYLDRRN